jgi:uncharacterized membrane protein YdjX (TVP38/TMEM64 family)
MKAMDIPKLEPRKSFKMQVPAIVWFYLAGLLLLLGAYALIPGFRNASNEAYTLLISNDRERIQLWVSGFGWWGPILIIALMLAQTLISAVPMIFVLIVSVLAYGPIWGAILGWGGAMLASVFGYGIARVFGDAIQDKLVTPKLRDVIESHVRRYGAWAILALRLSPLVPSDGVSFVAGLARMQFWPFVFGTIGGITPVVIAVAYFGSDFERLKTLIVVVTILSLGSLVAWIVFDRFFRLKKVSA